MKIYDGIDVRCPTCNARPGIRCTTASGLPASPPHRTRLDLSVVLRRQGQPA